MQSTFAPDHAPALKVTRVPAFDDNYLWLIHGTGAHAREVVAVDPGDAAPILAKLTADQLTLRGIFVTHHHADHVGGVLPLTRQFPVPVWGPATEDIPGRTIALLGGEQVQIPELGLSFAVIHVPGHTAGHIAYIGHGAVFCGDTLFSGGCGRLFEGTPAQMLNSLDQLAALPGETQVYCAHEYTAANLAFASVAEPDNRLLHQYQQKVSEQRAQGLPTIPTRIALERDINPFFRSRESTVRRTLVSRAGSTLLTDVAAFAALRLWKNEYRA
jgi:hydroxyacylglutathione hydrolase